MTEVPRAHFSHFGFHVRDIEPMVDFYSGLLGLEVTDRGVLHVFPGEPKIVFLSADPGEHHQIVLVEGRRDGADAGPVLQQISFHVESVDDLRAMKVAAEKAGVSEFRSINHGNGWSLYFPDPEGNNIECFVEAPWHVRQPVLDQLDLSLSDEEILAQTEALYGDAPDFQPREDWKESFRRRLTERWK